MTSNNKSKRAIVQRISRDTGMSESSIYKILTNPFNFSKSTVDTVRREAEKYGLIFTETTEAEAAHAASPIGDAPPSGILRIGAVIPSRPLYFWREAVMGIEKGKAHAKAELGVTVQTLYTYHNFPLTETEGEQLFASLRAERLNALIMFPVGGEACRRFIESPGTTPSGLPIPTVIFNDTQDYMTEAWFSAHPHTSFIGPDGYDEGRRAALMMQTQGRDIRHLAVICTRHNSSAQVSEERIRGVCNQIRELCPAVRISHVELDPTERIAPSMLARRLIQCYDGGEVDCMYISSGVTHIACAAIEKIERRLARPLPTFVIGHECSSADRRYLLEGRQRGYIKQDVYTQGMTAVRDLVDACLHGTPLRRRLYRSSVFIR